MADPQKKEITLDQFAQQMKSEVESGDPGAVEFANSLGEKYGPNGKTPLGRKLTNDELYSNYVEAHPEFTNLYSVTGIKSKGGVGGGGTQPGTAGGRGGGAGGPQRVVGQDAGNGWNPSLRSLTQPMAESFRGTAEKAVGAVAGAVPKLVGAPQGVSDFSTGLGEGLADVGINLTSPANLGLMIGTAFVPEAALMKSPKAAKLVGAIKTAMKYGFQGSMSLDALGSVAGFAEAYGNKDYKGMGRAAANALADVYLVKQAKEGGKIDQAGDAVKSKLRGPKPAGEETPKPPPGPPAENPVESKESVSVGDSKRPATSREFPEHTAKVLEARRSKSAEAIREIGNLQDSLNELDPIKDEKKIATTISKINSLTESLPEEERDPRIREQRESEGKKITSTSAKPPLPPGTISPQATANELASRSLPVGEHGSSASDRIAADKKAVEIPQRDSNPDNVQYSVQRLPGVPAGSTIIPRGSVPGKGFRIDVVDKSGRLTQAYLPFQDSIANMVRKGWMRKSTSPVAISSEWKTNLEGEPRLTRNDATFRTEPPAPPEPVPQPVHEVRSQNVPAVVPKKPVVPPGPNPFSNPRSVPAPPPVPPKLLNKAPYLMGPATEAPKPPAPPEPVPEAKPVPSPTPAVEHPKEASDTPAESNVGQVHPEIKATVQKLIDETITPKHESGSRSLIKDPWKNVDVQILGPKRKVLAQIKVPAGEFTAESIGKLIGENEGAEMIRISNPDSALKDVRIVPIPDIKPSPAAPPGPK